MKDQRGSREPKEEQCLDEDDAEGTSSVQAVSQDVGGRASSHEVRRRRLEIVASLRAALPYYMGDPMTRVPPRYRWCIPLIEALFSDGSTTQQRQASLEYFTILLENVKDAETKFRRVPSEDRAFKTRTFRRRQSPDTTEDPKERRRRVVGSSREEEAMGMRPFIGPSKLQPEDAEEVVVRTDRAAQELEQADRDVMEYMSEVLGQLRDRALIRAE